MNGKRKSERINPGYGYFVRNRQSGQPMGTLGNVTMEGLMIITGGRLDVNSKYQFRLDFPRPIRGISHLDLDARALWCNHCPESGSFQIGFQLLNIKGEDRETLRALMQVTETSGAAHEIRGGNPGSTDS
jgi:hypothetical protein